MAATRGVVERVATLIARRLKMRGVGRGLRRLYPVHVGATRYIRGIRRRADGLFVEVDSRELIDWTTIFFGEYEPHMRALFSGALVPGDVVVDVGANCGAHTLTLARCVGGHGRVLALEPNPPALGRLRRNVELNGFHNVVALPYATGARAARLQLRVPALESTEGANPGLASLVALKTPHTLVEVDVRPLDAVLREHNVREVPLVKIDVQGYEYEVLQGMRETLDQVAPLVVFEYEPWAWTQAGAAFDDARKLLEKTGYRFWILRQTVRARGGLDPLEEAPCGHVELVAMTEQRANAMRLRGLATGASRG